MLLWRHVMKADDAVDLADPANGREWLDAQPWRPVLSEPISADAVPIERDEHGEWEPLSAEELAQSHVYEFPAWGDTEQREWRHCIYALRSLTRRQKGYKPRHGLPGGEAGRAFGDDMADDKFRECIGKLRLVPRAVPSGSDLSLGEPWWTVERRFGGKIERVATRFQTFRLAILDTFWQAVFYSLVAGHFGKLCEGCRTPLQRTKKGHRPRRERCAKCYRRQWEAEQDHNRIKRQWAEQKKRQRAKQRNKGQTP